MKHGESVLCVDVLNMQLAASEFGTVFQMATQLLTQSSVTNKIHYICRPGVNADIVSVRIRHNETSYHDVFECESIEL